jgi:hypothetical protein
VEMGETKRLAHADVTARRGGGRGERLAASYMRVVFYFPQCRSGMADRPTNLMGYASPSRSVEYM